MKKLTFLATALALTLAFGEAQMAQAQDTDPEVSFVDENGDGIDDNVRRGHRRGHRGIVGRAGVDLTDEQKTELKTLVDGLKASEASKEDVRAAVEAKFTEWGIELPERPTIASRLGDALSEEQAIELTALVDGLKEAEASRDDIHAAVEAQLETWGIELPERPAFRGHLGDLLSEEQATELTALVQGLKDAETSAVDIRAAVDAQLETWGIEKPEKPEGQRRGKMRRGGRH